jgi:hypothetical protein
MIVRSRSQSFAAARLCSLTRELEFRANHRSQKIGIKSRVRADARRNHAPFAICSEI